LINLKKMKNNLEILIGHLNEDHKNVLRWFNNNKNNLVEKWPHDESLNMLLATKAKGIYKPKNLKYAVSVRSGLKQNYEDILNQKNDGSFKFKYFQENSDIRKRDLEYTNRAITQNINDVVPLGVIIQLKPKPYSQYKILGLGIVKGWEKGHFLIQSLNAE